ncbi:MAG: DoxX family protein [Bdellovibrionales bacterium]|nr:DoxX family protein [Bdellovibrionales bacterium]
MAFKPSTPIGNSIWGPLFVRLAVGSYFVLAGLAKLDNHALFISEVQKMGVLPPMMSTLYGILLPYVEIVGGGLFLIGLWTILSGFLLGLLLISFVIALGFHPSAFGPFNKDLILLAAVISVMYSGAGALSIDRFRTTGG